MTERNRRITIQRIGTGQDRAGQPIKNAWQDFIRPWASIRYLNGKQYVTAGKEVSDAAVSIRIRYRTDITPDMRVVHGSTIYDILAILPDEEDRENLDLVCKTGAKK